MPIALIAAAAGKNLVIGKDGDLPWHYSEDLKYFKRITMNHPVLMGRKTYQSILKRLGKPLPGRQNIVLTRDKNFKDDRVKVIHDIKEINSLKNEMVFVIGGAEVYQQTLPVADIIYMTHIKQDVAGDAFFPPLTAAWKLKDKMTATEKGVELEFCTYRKD